MSRTKGAISKKVNLPEVFSFTTEQRVALLASLLLEIVSEELCKKS